jgi:hypothetical protein
MDHKMSRSPWVIHYDGSSCNGCDIEVLASLTFDGIEVDAERCSSHGPCSWTMPPEGQAQSACGSGV